MDPDLPNLAFRARMGICAARCGNRNKLAERSGIGLSTLSRYFSGSEPTRPMLALIAEAAQVSADWLVTGREPISTSESGGPAPAPATAAHPRHHQDDEYVRLPRIVGSRKDEAGTRILVFDDLRAFVPRVWLTTGIKGINPDDLAAYFSDSAEMEPEILDGEMLLISTSHAARAPTEDRRLVRIYDRICVRNIHRVNQDTFLMTHANMPPGLEGKRFTREQLGYDVDILGKIIVALRHPSRFPMIKSA